MAGSVLTFEQILCAGKSGLPDGKLLSLACPRESNQRERHPAAPVLRTAHVTPIKSGGCGTRAARSDSPRRKPPILLTLRGGAGGGSSRVWCWVGCINGVSSHIATDEVAESAQNS
jgi:hypothetical protein